MIATKNVDGLHVMIMMMSSNVNNCCGTGPLWGESTGDWWIPLSKASDVELWCLFWSAPEQTDDQTIEMSVIWDAIALNMMSLWCWGQAKIATSLQTYSSPISWKEKNEFLL